MKLKKIVNFLFLFLFRICKFQHTREFKTDQQRVDYEKTNSITQFIIYDTISLPFSNDTDYVQISKNKILAKADDDRFKASGFIIYLVNKNKSSEQLNLTFKGDLKMKSNNCVNTKDLDKKFKLIELNSNVFALVLLDAIKEHCIISLSLDIQSKFTTQNMNFNRESYKIQLIIYEYNQDFTIAGNLQSKCLFDSKIC